MLLENTGFEPVTMPIVAFLPETRYSREQELSMNAEKTAEDLTVTDGKCPFDHIPNAETVAAFEEGEAMLRGEIPSAVFINPRQRPTREELKAALKEAL
jgi:hypothetical protein